MDKGIVIAGATGEVGKRLVEKLIVHNQNSTINALVRSICPDLPPQVIQHVVDFSKLEQFHLEQQFSMAYCCLGTTIKHAGSDQAFKQIDHLLVVQFARWVQQHGCDKFACITAIGANRKSSNFYLKVKGETEHDLTQRNFKHLWLVRPSLLLGDRAEFRLGEYLGTLLSKIAAPFMQGPLLKYRPIKMIELAETMALLAEIHNPKEGCHVLEGKYLYAETYSESVSGED